MIGPTKRDLAALLAVGALLVAAPGEAQLYESGSTGVLGALAPTEDVEIILPEDGVLHYTTVDIPEGVTVTFRRNKHNTGIYLLSQTDITIDGTVDASGQAGVVTAGLSGISRLGGLSGPGGSDGASSGGVGMGSGIGPGPGARAGGGGLGDAAGGGASLINNGYTGKPYYGNQPAGAGGSAYGDAGYQPLHGGSGGGAASHRSGGGGGGLLVLASSTTIVVNGEVLARGGGGWRHQDFPHGGGGAGGGGVIRLAAPEVHGGGVLDARGGFDNCTSGSSGSYPGCGGNGLIRVESFDIDLGIQANAQPGIQFAVPQKSVPYPSIQRPVLEIASVGGKVPVLGANQGHVHQTPGVSVPMDTTLTITVAGEYIPIDTAVKVIINVVGQERTEYEAVLTEGTFESSSGTVDVAIPANAKIGTIEAWIPNIPLPQG